MLHTNIALIVGGAFHDAAIPDYARVRLQNENQATRLLSNVMWACGGVFVLATFLLLLFSDQILNFVGSGFSEEQLSMSKRFLWLTLPFSLCYGTAAIFRGYLQANGRFGLSSGAQAFIPLTTIVVLIVAPSPVNPDMLPIGASVGSIVALLVLIVAAQRMGEKSFVQKPGWDSKMGAVLRHVVPLGIGAAIMEACFFVDIAMAASLKEGSVAILTYGERICNIVLAVAGTAASQVIFPHISGLIAAGSWHALIRVMWRFSALCVLSALPLMAFFWFASEPIVRLLLERGEFTAEDTRKVAEVLEFSALKIPGYILAVLGTRVVLALKGNRFLMISAILALQLNVGLNVWFMEVFGVKGVALSTAVVAVFSSVSFFVYMTVKAQKQLRDAG